MGLFQGSNDKYDALEEEHRLLKRRYKTLEEDLIPLKFSLLCEEDASNGEGDWTFKIDLQTGRRIPPTRLPVPGSWHQIGQVIEAGRPRHQPAGPRR